MKVKLKLFSPFSEIFNKAESEIELHSTRNVLGLLNILCNSSERRGKIFDDSGKLKPYVTVLINGRPIKALDGVQTELKAGDEIAIFPPVAGG